MAKRQQAVVLGTWAFSVKPVTVAAQRARAGETCLDCIEKGCNVAETNESYGPYLVGIGGPPNQKGEVELDAAMMSGKDLGFGAVTALKGISQALSVARCVMERSTHSMLTSQGARDFAIHCGFQLDTPEEEDLGCGDNSETERKGEGAFNTQRMELETSPQHDTLGLLVLDSHSNVAAGVTTSGMKDKARGRIGDSALPGCGLYADSEVGAVCCSGEGDEIMKYCPSFMVIEFMRQGMSPEEACQAAVRRIMKRRTPSPPFELAIIALSAKGEVGAATTVKEWTDPVSGQTYPGFPYVVWRAGEEGGSGVPKTLVVPPVS